MTSTPAFAELPVPTRQARSAATRERILDSATAMFVSVGITAVSLRDVAARAGVTHPGLLRHFPSKDALLGAVVERLDRANESWIEHEPHDEFSLGLAALARRNAGTPGYLELYTALSGEATSASHAAHAHMRERYARVRAAVADQLATEPVRAGIDPDVHAALVIAAWDGLQLQERYSPDDVDLVGDLARHERWLRGAPALPFADDDRSETEDAAPIAATIILEPEEPGRVGREQRARIDASAIELFARSGYHGTSLREIAERSGIPKSTLLHHIGSKDELLTSVLRLRDRRTITGDAPAGPARDRLPALAEVADRAAADPGLIELYAVLSCEGATPGHPAHDHFERRFRESRRYFTDLFRRMRDEGSLQPDRDPRREAAWLIATWDGLQIQWLYDPSIEVGAHLRAHFRDLVAA
ncbi:TetR/AcrR family transcriptional regulator [Agromyces sp. NPDC056379]|uniref:TetR/AcrR family transcriptional regulator n=1 Tax=unclassified Agromyces TaxID=2639701 RepID=UPI0035E29868